MTEQETYKYISDWWAFVRRHKANIFEVFFMDKEHIKDEDVPIIVERIASFFLLPVPTILSQGESIAEVMVSDDANLCELSFNMEMMQKAGINNLDVLVLSLVHEMGHQYLRDRYFMLFDNELWIQELAADMIAGAFCERNDLASGKYKYVLEQLKPTMTHPDGKLRSAIVDYGREQARHLVKQQAFDSPDDILQFLPDFVYTHYRELQSAWSDVRLEDEMKGEVNEKRSPINIDALPDTNLIKQATLKYRKQKEEQDNETN